MVGREELNVHIVRMFTWTAMGINWIGGCVNNSAKLHLKLHNYYNRNTKENRGLITYLHDIVLVIEILPSFDNFFFALIEKQLFIW